VEFLLKILYNKFKGEKTMKFCFLIYATITIVVLAVGCGGDGDKDNLTPVSQPILIASLSDSWQEGWLASPAVADIDGDTIKEIIACRHNLVVGWHLDNSVVFQADAINRIWASPIVADLNTSVAGLEIAAASDNSIYVWEADGDNLAGFPVTWRSEIRSLAAGDIDGDDELELVGASTTVLSEISQKDYIIAFNMNGMNVDGFPPNTTGAAGCDEHCYVNGGYDQNLAIGDVDGDNVADIFGTHDNAYMSLHKGNGYAFDAAAIFVDRSKFMGVRFLHDYSYAQQGWAPIEVIAYQSQFTNAAPAIADIDGNGQNDLVALGSVSEINSGDNEMGVGLWVVHNDGTRLPNWTEPFHAPDYLAGLLDYDGNIVAKTHQVTVADLYKGRAGLEMVFAGFDGKIYCVDASRQEIWNYTYTQSDRVLTGGVIAADLSADTVPEIIFATYSPDNDVSHLVILNRNGTELHRISLPGRGAMAVPTVDDANGNGTMEIVVNLKDGAAGEPLVLVYEVPGSNDSSLAWPTGRANYLRNGFIE
jgi:hypothetical protein